MRNYALALTDPDPNATVPLLTDAAVQVACLGRKQLAYLEWALATGFTQVIEALHRRGLDDLTPAFAYAVAPVQLLILDGRKHRGERSLAWQWFRTYGPRIETLVGSKPRWASGNALYLWSRTGANLTGMPLCGPGQSGSTCVDLIRFINSLMDPRAIGLGECALLGMIANGVTTIQGNSRYLCLSLPCSQTGTDQETRDRLAPRWRSFGTEAAVPVTSADGIGNLCQDSAGAGLQGAGFSGLAGASPQDCIDGLSGGNTNPWDRYDACVTEAVGAEEPGGQTTGVESFAPLPGVPAGTKCGLLADAGTGGGQADGDTTPSPQPAADKAKEEEQEAKDEEPPAEDQAKEEEPRTPETSAIAPTTTSDAAVDSSKLPPSEPNAPGLWDAILDVLRTTTHVGPFMRPEPTDGRSLSDETRRQVELIRAQQGQGKDCADESGCADACTGLGSQIARMNACTEDLLGAVDQARGRTRPQPAPGETYRPQPYTVIYDPEHAPLPESDIGACLMGDTGPSGQGGDSCRFVLCPGLNSLALPAGTNCGCGGDRAGQWLGRVTQQCYAVNCPDGLPTAQCGCMRSDLRTAVASRTFESTPPMADSSATRLGVESGDAERPGAGFRAALKRRRPECR